MTSEVTKWSCLLGRKSWVILMDYLFRVSPGATLHHEQVALHGGLCYRLFCSLPRNSSVSTWPTRRYITISKKCFSCKSKQSVYKRELPWKLPILLVTRLEFWISSSRYLHNIIRYLTGCVHSGALEREFSFWRPCLLLIYKTLQCLYSPPSCLLRSMSYPCPKRQWKTHCFIQRTRTVRAGW